MGDAEVDTLMREIAARLTRTVGDAGTVARLTESEFAVILPRGSSERASQLAQRILAVLYEPIELSGLLLDARSSIGISLFPGHGSEADALMRRASIALDQARASGNAVALFKGGLDRECAQRLSLMGELRGAIERDELLLYCQPKLQISSGRVCGAEALVRWQHPRLGVMNPGEFIKLAESTGLITPLTYQSFVADMMSNKDSATIVRSTIELAHNLDLTVIAEGVEDQGTYDRLAALGCDMAQGYCISRPIPADQFQAWEAEPVRHH